MIFVRNRAPAVIAARGRGHLPDAMAGLARRFGFALAVMPCLLSSCGRPLPNDRADGSQAGAVGATGGTAGAGAAGGHAALDGGAPAGSGGAGTGGQPAGASGTISLDGSPIYTRVQRLTNGQWERAVTDVLRFASPANLSQGFSTPFAAGAADFANNERFLFVDQQAEVDFETASEKAAALATGSPDALAKVYAGTDAAGFVRTFGRRAFRRPLTTDEEARYQGLFAVGERLYGAGFANGAALVIRAMLQSPKFLYRSELGPAGAALDSYEIASKLSFGLLGTTPSDELLDAAGAGALDSIDGLERAARAMLERPEVVEVMRDFHGQLYRLDRCDDVDRPGVPASMRSELAETSYRFFDAVFTAGEGLRAILTSTRYFVGPGLAGNYPAQPTPAQIEERVLEPSRIGYFMQVPFLLRAGRDDGPDTMARGLALADEVLCLDLPAHPAPQPPLPALAAGQTNRDRIETVTASCAGCHRDLINPLGFAFEGFDGFGQRRDLDNGVTVDSTGSYTFEGGASPFADARDLMRILADSPRAHTCYAKMLTGYALQRDLVENDRPLLTELAAVSRARSLKEMVISLVRNPAFRSRPGGTP
jgi:hypothetical protein